MTRDAESRGLALDVRRSFIVQAPAGSGKTELLIQRYLALLASVDAPEQVLAITFTRKAAAEMRHRVLTALAEAETQTSAEPAHRRQTYRLAMAALERSRQLDWSLELQPQRMRIETLDSLNAWLARRLSVLAGGIGAADVTENAGQLYELAVKRTMEALGEGSPLDSAITRLLEAEDNNATRLTRMLADLLPTRDQWLPYLVSDDAEFRSRLEAALSRLIEEALSRLTRQLPVGFAEEVSDLLRQVAAEASDPGKAARFAVWRLYDTALTTAVESLDAWRAVPELLLTRTKSWRKRWTVADGVTAQQPAVRQRLLDLVSAHRQDEALLSALHGIRGLPPAAYASADWALIAALQRTLRHLVAELKVIFGERHSADFVELALAAQQALGRVDDPSELLLALDRRLQHVLVDEFQDTSHTQLRLLKLLTSGWEPGDGRTIFLVGDPMQSIYRFRHADMSLFLKTQAQGVGGITLTPLVLESNFRSAPALVEWVNAAFARIFPAVDDMGSGAARFHASRSTRAREAHQDVHWHVIRSASPSVEIARVTEILHAELKARPCASIAVLVRSRSHLVGLQEELRAGGIIAHAVELEAPRQQQIVQDLIGLTRALVHLEDRIAWLGVLRAPWCGLTWRDLLGVAAAAAERSLWAAMRDEDALARLTADGRARLSRVRRILDRAFSNRAERSFERWIEHTWIALGGPRCLEREEDTRSAERFFATLAALTIDGDIDDPAVLEEAFAEPHGQGDAPRESGIEIMTIHRAKGLEFDTVILLGLARRPRAEGRRGLYWLERTAADGSEDLLLAPLASVADGSSQLTDFIRRADAVRDHAESTRLLYVATTRARERLHLVAQLDTGAPQAGSLLAHLWAEAADHFARADVVTETTPTPEWIVPMLRRLRDQPIPPELTPRAQTAVDRPEFLWVRHAAVQAGTVVHAVLHEIAASGIAAWTRELIAARRPRFRRELILLGVDEGELDDSVQRIVAALCAVLDDTAGRWLLSSHAAAVSEFAVTLRTADGLEHLRIDRTFVDETGLRWIVDFKTSQHTGGAVETFLDSEVVRYRRQLAAYAHAMAALDNRPMRVGLYFPLLQAFRSWDPSGDVADT